MSEAEISNAPKAKIVKYIYNYSKSFGWKKQILNRLNYKTSAYLLGLFIKRKFNVKYFRSIIRWKISRILFN